MLFLKLKQIFQPTDVSHPVAVLEHAQKEYDCAFLDDRPQKVVDGVPVIGKTSDIEQLFGKYKKLLVTIGNNALR